MLFRETVSIFLVFVSVRSQFLPSSLNYNLDAFTPTDDVLCDQQLLEFYLSLIAGELWALGLLDTWGKLQSGLSDGNLFNMGLSQKCKSFRRKDEEKNSSFEFRGKHCLVGLESLKEKSSKASVGGINLSLIGETLGKVNLTIAHGVCLPASCSNKKIVKFLGQFLKKAGIRPIGAQCNTDEHEPFGAVDYAAASIVAILALLLVSSTTYDSCKRRSANEPNRVLSAFSVYTNGQKLFQTTTENTDVIGCFFGLRALSTFWIIILHRFLAEFGNRPFKNPLDLFGMLERWYAWLVIASTFAVDTFFVVGGVLVTISLMQAFEKKTFNYLKFMLHRYLRYAPIVAALMILASPGFKILNEHLLELLQRNCNERWWTNLLMINNFLDQSKACFSVFWYLAVDFQLYAVSPLIVFCLRKFGWKFFWTLPVLMAGSSIYVTLTCLQIEDWFLREQQAYFTTQARLGPWIIGIMLGYLLSRFRDKKCQISRKLSFLLWSLTALLLWFPVYFSVLMLRMGEHVELLENAIFMGVRRQLWALGVAWIIFACHKLESGGFIKWLLCLDIWQPIGRMTLSIYATHSVYAEIMVLQRKDIISFDIASSIHTVLGDIMAMLPIGCLFYLTFEAPIQAIDKYFKNCSEKNQINITREDSKNVDTTNF